MARTKTDNQTQEVSNTSEPTNPTRGLAFSSKMLQERKDSERDALPVTGSQRQEALPDARRSKRIERTIIEPEPVPAGDVVRRHGAFAKKLRAMFRDNQEFFGQPLWLQLPDPNTWAVVRGSNKCNSGFGQHLPNCQKWNPFVFRHRLFT